jgi:NADH-quinone oxidoreductase subunit F/NADP-reducing hydrogenase subunit HndC
LYQFIEKITNGEGELEDLDKIKELCAHMQSTSLCALGQTTPNPVISTMHYFADEYIAHVKDKTCPAGVCKNLLSYEIMPDLCKGCTLCARNCPVDAISGSVKKPHKIDREKCIKCGLCMRNCKFNAIIKK